MIDLKIPRVVEYREETMDLFTIAHIIESTPCPISNVSAIAVMPGLGEDVRLIAAINAWEANSNVSHFLVSGTNGKERTQKQPSLAYLRDYMHIQREEGVETQVSAEHTREQAQWILSKARELKVDSIALFVSHWHLPRAYSTLIKLIIDEEKTQMRIPVFPYAVATPPNAVVPETNVNVVTMSAGEAERIKRYQEVGHATTLLELQEYINWLWAQSIVPIKQVHRI